MDFIATANKIISDTCRKEYCPTCPLINGPCCPMKYPLLTQVQVQARAKEWLDKYSMKVLDENTVVVTVPVKDLKFYSIYLGHKTLQIKPSSVCLPINNCVKCGSIIQMAKIYRSTSIVTLDVKCNCSTGVITVRYMSWDS